MNELVTIMVFIKDAGEKYTKIPKQFIGELAQSIAKNGSEYIHLGDGGSLEIVGFMVYSKQIGERVIITGQGGTGNE